MIWDVIQRERKNSTTKKINLLGSSDNDLTSDDGTTVTPATSATDYINPGLPAWIIIVMTIVIIIGLSMIIYVVRLLLIDRQRRQQRRHKQSKQSSAAKSNVKHNVLHLQIKNLFVQNAPICLIIIIIIR